MKKILFALLLLCSTSFAQVAAVTANVKTLGTSVDISGMKVRFELRSNDANGKTQLGCGAGVTPRVLGTAIFGDYNFDNFTINSTTGALTGNIYRNDFIDCGGVTPTYYWVYIMRSGQKTYYGQYTVDAGHGGATFNLNSASQSSAPTFGVNTSYMDLLNNQTAAGIKTFSSSIATPQASITGVGSGSSLILAVTGNISGNKGIAITSSSNGAAIDIQSSISSTGVNSQSSAGGVPFSGTTGDNFVYNATNNSASNPTARFNNSNASAAKIVSFQKSSSEKSYVDGNGIFQGTQNGLESVPLVLASFSSTITFDGSSAQSFEMVLTGNVTSSSVSSPVAGRTYTFLICQDGSGSHTFAWPAAFKGTTTIGSTASKCNVQQFFYDATSFYAVAPGQINQ